MTLTNLLNYLPKTNDPGCSAGFAHGMLIALGPQIQKLGPKGAAADCNRAPTRYQRYSCIHGLGHAYARQFNDFVDPALASCGKLGRSESLDCAQGVFHDYWIAVAGLDGRGGRPAPSPRPGSSWPRSLLAMCACAGTGRSWSGRRRSCRPLRAGSSRRAAGSTRSSSPALTGASLIRSDDPLEQLRTCAGLDGSEAADCLRGLRVQTYALAPFSTSSG